MKKLLALLLAMAMVFSLVACAGGTTEAPAEEAPAEEEAAAEEGGEEAAAESEAPLKVAMVLPGEINDVGWNQFAYEGLVAAEEQFGVEIAYTDSIDQVNFESATREYAAAGYDLILGIGAEFTDAFGVVGAEYPDVLFADFNGNVMIEPNVASYRYTTTETGFLAGTIAALISKSGVAGYVYGSSAAHFQDSEAGFKAGFNYINPDGQALAVCTDNFDDVALAKTTAQGMVDQGADVLMGNANTATMGVIECAAENGLLCLGYANDQHTVDDCVKVSVVQDNKSMVLAIVKSVLDGEFKAAINLKGVADGAIFVTDWYNADGVIDDEGLAKIDEVIAGIVDGSLKEQGILPKTSFE